MKKDKKESNKEKAGDIVEVKGLIPVLQQADTYLRVAAEIENEQEYEEHNEVLVSVIKKI
jgi:hypothetical protein